MYLPVYSSYCIYLKAGLSWAQQSLFYVYKQLLQLRDEYMRTHVCTCTSGYITWFTLYITGQKGNFTPKQRQIVDEKIAPNIREILWGWLQLCKFVLNFRHSCWHYLMFKINSLDNVLFRSIVISFLRCICNDELIMTVPVPVQYPGVHQNKKCLSNLAPVRSTEWNLNVNFWSPVHAITTYLRLEIEISETVLRSW